MINSSMDRFSWENRHETNPRFAHEDHGAFRRKMSLKAIHQLQQVDWAVSLVNHPGLPSGKQKIMENHKLFDG